MKNGKGSEKAQRIQRLNSDRYEALNFQKADAISKIFPYLYPRINPVNGNQALDNMFPFLNILGLVNNNAPE